jgi:hypothetical protein
MKLQRKIGDYEIVVACKDDFKDQGESLLKKLAELNERGPALKDGTLIEFGWAPIRLQADGDVLVVCEPDFDGDALKNFVKGVDRVLQVLTWQAKILRATGVKGEPSHFNQKLVMVKACLSLRRIYLEREPTERKDDTGWYIGDEKRPEAREQVSELEGIYVWQLVKLRPALMKVLAFPPGYLILMEGDEPESILDPAGKDLWAP